jgi:RNA-splicing ligase RtcB
MEISGKYGSAIVYNDDVEQEAISQIINLLNQPMAEGANVRIMPDCHAGAGCVIGYTAKKTDKIVPNLIGVDIGCGVTGWKLGKRSVVGEKFDKLDKIIRTHVPSGRTINDEVDEEEIETIFNTLDTDYSFRNFFVNVEEVCKRTGQDSNYIWRSAGSLGGGNHFIEIDKDDNDELWLVIHSGSRNFGLKIALWHQQVAEQSLFSMSKEDFDNKVEEIKQTKKGKGIEVAIKALRTEASRKGKATGLEFLEGEDAEAYYHDMNIAQIYAQLNRRVMGNRILKKMYKMDYFQPVESVHNYINFKDGIVRKGAISAHDGEEVIIPLNMADGIIMGVGKGNDAWNNSAAHGAGRKMSRSKAKSTIRLEDFQKRMKDAGVWSSCVGKSTLDEAPQAYKKADKIVEYLQETVDVKVRMFPVYNFKATE